MQATSCSNIHSLSRIDYSVILKCADIAERGSKGPVRLRPPSDDEASYRRT